MESLQSTEYAFLRAPYEELSSQFRRNKRKLEKEVSFAASHLKTMYHSANNLHTEQARVVITGLLNRLRALREALERAYEEEDS